MKEHTPSHLLILINMSRNPIRIIPFLDIKNGLLIKGINLEGLRVLGKAENFSNYYYLSGADEICYIDNVATLYGTNSWYPEHSEFKKYVQALSQINQQIFHSNKTKAL